MSNSQRLILAAIAASGEGDLSPPERAVLKSIAQRTFVHQQPQSNTSLQVEERGLSTRETCAMLNVGRTKLYELSDKHPELLPIKSGNNSYLLSGILQWMEKMKVQAHAKAQEKFKSGGRHAA